MCTLIIHFLLLNPQATAPVLKAGDLCPAFVCVYMYVCMCVCVCVFGGLSIWVEGLCVVGWRGKGGGGGGGWTALTLCMLCE